VNQEPALVLLDLKLPRVDGLRQSRALVGGMCMGEQMK
jgi:DNA-binding response OmpR family regulator